MLTGALFAKPGRTAADVLVVVEEVVVEVVVVELVVLVVVVDVVVLEVVVVVVVLVIVVVLPKTANGSGYAYFATKTASQRLLSTEVPVLLCPSDR